MTTPYLHHMFDGGMGPGMGVWMIFQMVLSFVFILALVLLIAWGIQWARKSGVGHVEESALDILKKRYARGEIGKEEFEEKKRDLM